MLKYHKNAWQRKDTHRWVAERLQALGFETDSLLILAEKNRRQSVMWQGLRLFIYKYTSGTIYLDKGVKFNRFTGVLTREDGSTITPDEKAVSLDDVLMMAICRAKLLTSEG